MGVANFQTRQGPKSAVRDDDVHQDATDRKQRAIRAAAQEHEDEARTVHEITDSSSDEGEHDRVSRSRCLASSRSRYESFNVEKTSREGESSLERPKVDLIEPMDSRECMSDLEEGYNTQNVADMHYLFTNDKLKNESPALVLRSDPFCIPRVTDNVLEYRPTLNPLSIFLGEDQLVPRNLRLDPTETLPNGGNAAMVKKDTRKRPRRTLLPSQISSSSSRSSRNHFHGKTSAFMGTMPRQADFTESLVSEKLFQNHEVYGVLPPLSWVSSFSRQLLSNSETNHATFDEGASSMFSTSVSLSDAMLLSSIQHTLNATNGALAVTDCTMSLLDSASDSATPSLDGKLERIEYEMEPLQPLEAIADALTNYLPICSTGNCQSTEEQLHNVAESYDISGEPDGYASATPIVRSPFGSILAPAQSREPCSGSLVHSGGAQSVKQNRQTSSSALDFIALSTCANSASKIQSGLVTFQRNVARVDAQVESKKARTKNVLRACLTSGCTKGARGKSGLCQKHGGGKRCATPNCPKGAQGSSRMCLFHGGGYRCTMEGCRTGARGTSGLCARHGGYKKGATGTTAKRGAADENCASQRLRADKLPLSIDLKAE